MSSIDLPTLLTFIITIFGVFSGVVLWAIRVMLDSRVRPIADEQIRLEKEHHRLDRKFLQFQATLPEKYVTREDWIRQINVIDAKQDVLGERQLRTHDLLIQLDQRIKSGGENTNGK